MYIRNTFILWRDSDVTGVSGTGAIAEGVLFTDGTVVLRWAPQPERAANSSVAVWPDMDSMIGIHGHDGKTWVKWDTHDVGHSGRQPVNEWYWIGGMAA